MAERFDTIVLRELVGFCKQARSDWKRFVLLCGDHVTQLYSLENFAHNLVKRVWKKKTENAKHHECNDACYFVICFEQKSVSFGAAVPSGSNGVRCYVCNPDLTDAVFTALSPVIPYGASLTMVIPASARGNQCRRGDTAAFVKNALAAPTAAEATACDTETANWIIEVVESSAPTSMGIWKIVPPMRHRRLRVEAAFRLLFDTVQNKDYVICRRLLSMQRGECAGARFVRPPSESGASDGSRSSGGEPRRP